MEEILERYFLSIPLLLLIADPSLMTDFSNILSFSIPLEMTDCEAIPLSINYPCSSFFFAVIGN
jgi:hypothetical protein